MKPTLKIGNLIEKVAQDFTLLVKIVKIADLCKRLVHETYLVLDPETDHVCELEQAGTQVPSEMTGILSGKKVVLVPRQEAEAVNGIHHELS